MTSPLPYNRQNALASAIAADNASSIAGKIVLTTGVTQGGLGTTFVQAIAQYNPRLLILAGRSAEKVAATTQALKCHPSSSDVQIRFLPLNLSKQPSIRSAANKVLSRTQVPHIDVLINSAATTAGPYLTTTSGIETPIRHQPHRPLPAHPISSCPNPLLAPAPRVVSVASDGHRFSGVRFHDVRISRTDGGYEQWDAYR
jgi:NAD(P)-dependent dehydrogenase (short-subunit alcohol dehydrogenase family)